MKRLRPLLFVVGVLACGVALAEAIKPEVAIAYRQSVYRMIRWNFVPMVAMVKGEQPFDARQFALRATRVSFLSRQLDEAYPAGSDQGADTDALPAIWENHAEFRSKLADFQREARVLRVAAEAGDQAAIKAQFMKTAGTCKACHDEYRAD